MAFDAAKNYTAVQENDFCSIYFAKPNDDKRRIESGL